LLVFNIEIITIMHFTTAPAPFFIRHFTITLLHWTVHKRHFTLN